MTKNNIYIYIAMKSFKHCLNKKEKCFSTDCILMATHSEFYLLEKSFHHHQKTASV